MLHISSNTSHPVRAPSPFFSILFAPVRMGDMTPDGVLEQTPILDAARALGRPPGPEGSEATPGDWSDAVILSKMQQLWAQHAGAMGHARQSLGHALDQLQNAAVTVYYLSACYFLSLGS